MSRRSGKSGRRNRIRHREEEQIKEIQQRVEEEREMVRKEIEAQNTK